MTDTFRKYASLFSTTSSSFGTGSDVDITLNSATGLPTDTDITLTFDRVDANGAATTLMERIIGTVSGVTFAVKERGADGTTERAHTTPVVEMVFNAADWNGVVDGLLVNYNQDGSFQDLDVSNITGSNVDTVNLTASNINISNTVEVDGVIDDDTMATASDSTLATSESVKAYVDDQVSIVTVDSDTTPNPTGDAKRNELYITALAGAAEFAAPSGSVANGNVLIIRVKDNGTARALTYNAIYDGLFDTLPATTTLGKYLYMGFVYNSTSEKWEMLAYQTEE